MYRIEKIENQSKEPYDITTAIHEMKQLHSSLRKYRQDINFKLDKIIKHIGAENIGIMTQKSRGQVKDEHNENQVDLMVNKLLQDQMPMDVFGNLD